MRKYSGIHEQVISFRIWKNSWQPTPDSPEIQQKLEKLQQDGIISYRSENTDAEITFLMPRDDERTINYISPQVRWYNENKVNQCNEVLAYIEQEEKVQPTISFGILFRRDKGRLWNLFLLYRSQTEKSLKGLCWIHIRRNTTPCKQPSHVLTGTLS